LVSFLSSEKRPNRQQGEKSGWDNPVTLMPDASRSD
jgi:hypothetical protein